MKHQLSLEVPDSNNCKILRVIDTSKYIEDFTTTCEYLQVTAPGFLSPVQIEVDPGFNLILTACSLGLQTTECGDEQYNLPDGVYNIKYSISPNTEVVVEYNYLKVSQILNHYYRELASLEIHGCPIEYCAKEKLKSLTELKSFIDVAKAKVEYFNEVKEGVDILKYANKKLTAYRKICCK